MIFKHAEIQEDGGGYLTITAENSEEVVDLSKHFRIFDQENSESLIEYAQAIQRGQLVYESKPSKRLWFYCDSALDHKFVEPYRRELEKRTGFIDPLPNVDLTSYHPRRLCHTHITDVIGLVDGHIVYKVIIQAEDWNNKPAEERADIDALDYVEEDIGNRPHESEFIQCRNGQYTKNPDYLKRRRCQPALLAEWLWDYLFAWWRVNHASKEQERILSAAEELYNRSKLHYGTVFGVREYTIYYLDPAGKCNWDSKGTMVSVIDWAQFAKL
jgi:hypothetical protein